MWNICSEASSIKHQGSRITLHHWLALGSSADSPLTPLTPLSPRWAKEGNFIWPRALRSRANMTVCGDSRAGSALRFLHSERAPVFGYLVSFLPVGLGRGAQPKTDQGERLSEPKASSSSTPFSASTAGCPGAQRRGPRPSGRLFLCLLSFWRRKKKVSCRRATPGLMANQKVVLSAARHDVRAVRQPPAAAHPAHLSHVRPGAPVPPAPGRPGSGTGRRAAGVPVRCRWR